MAHEETTTKFKVDISELKSAMQEAKRAAAVAKSEFELVKSTCDDWTKSSDGLSAKINSLNSTLDSQKTKLALLEAQYNDLSDEQKQGSKAADDLVKQINYQKAAINNTEREISNYESSLQDVSKAEKIAAATGKDVAEVLDDIEEEAEGAGDGFTVFKGAIATFAGNVLTGFANAIKSGISNIANLADETREYRNEMAKLDTAFTTNGHSAETASKTYKDLYAVLGDEGQAVEASNHLAKLATTEQDLANWTNIATGVYATFGASLPIEGLTEAANETAKVGQVTGPLADALNWTTLSTEQWNAALQSNPAAMKAFNAEIKNGASQEDAFNAALEKCSTEQERQQLIMSALNGMYSDSADAFRETNGAVMEANRANSDYADNMAALGEKVEPITTALKEGFGDLLGKILELVEGVDMSAFTTVISDAFSTLTDTVLPAVVDGFQWILDNKDGIIAGLVGIGTGFAVFRVASLINGVVTAFKAFKAANEGATVAQWLLNAAMNANPIMLLVTVIAAIVGAIVTFIATNDEARAKFMEIWGAVKDFFVGVWDGIVSFFTETIPNAFKTVIDWVKENFDTLLTFLLNPFAGLFKYFYENNTKFKEFVDNAVQFIKELPGKVWEWLLNTIDKVKTWIKDMTEKAKEAGKEFVSKAVEFIKELPGKIWTWLSNAISKAAEWVSNMVSKAKEAGTNFVNNVVTFISELPGKIWTWFTDVVQKVVEWGTNLATKGKEAGKKLLDAIVEKVKEIPGKMLEIGKNIVEGIWNGISNSLAWIKSKITGWVGNVTDFIKNLFGIHSPSRVMRDEVGKQLTKGIAVGITEGSGEVNEAFTKLLEDLDLQKELGVITEEEYYEELTKLRDEYLQEGTKEWWDYTKDIINYTKEAENELEETNEDFEKQLRSTFDDAVEQQFNYIKEQKEMGLITEEEYYEGLTQLRDTFFEEGTDGWRTYTKEILEYQRTQLDNAKKERDQFVSDLSSGRKMFGDVTFTTAMGTEAKAARLTNWGADIAELTEFDNILGDVGERLKVAFGDDTEHYEALMQLIRDGGLGEGKDLATLLLGASDEDLQEYIDGWREVERLTNKVADGQYSGTIDEMQAEYDKGLAEFQENVPDDFMTTGQLAAEGFALGFIESLQGFWESIAAALSGAYSVINPDDVGLGDLVGATPGQTAAIVNNYVQNIHSPKDLSRLDIYRQTKNLLNYNGGKS